MVTLLTHDVTLKTRASTHTTMVNPYETKTELFESLSTKLDAICIEKMRHSLKRISFWNQTDMQHST
jgi:hypothetical protein